MLIELPRQQVIYHQKPVKANLQTIARNRQEDLLEKDMATHSSILAWGIPWTEEPDGLQSMGSQRVKYDLATKSPNMQVNSESK